MTATVIPATKVSLPTWAFLSISRNVSVTPAQAATATTAAVPAAFVTNPQANLQHGTQDFIGDANGNPIQAVPFAGMGVTNSVLDLSEVVTRADGTKLSVLALIDSIAMAVADAAK